MNGLPVPASAAVSETPRALRRRDTPQPPLAA